MFDFVLSAVASLAANLFLIGPYWDRLKEYWLSQGHTAAQVSTPYYVLCGLSYLAVGLCFYLVLKLLRWLIHFIQNRQ